MTDPVTAPEQILIIGKGYCAPKHYLLAEMYRRLGYDVAYATFPFLWNDPDLAYPPELRRLASALPVAYHLACRVRIGSRRVLVDATWDPPLARGGFPVNIRWDGHSDTLCAVKPLRSAVRTAFCRTATSEPFRKSDEKELLACDGEEDHADAEARERYFRHRAGKRTQEEIQRILRFNQEFDAWLDNLRRPPCNKDP
ncbi:MAG: hypothetical protein A4E34_01554 [Methanoregula sp. PtaU1.Bin006]|nr:MAG: hypothetical protein A4E33_02824 [Methanoregula sp. PtaB.Bin085]OPY33969.1 MAG: hypothetical protein A4E34_01554 [Methanoregula sp. PtaU1.Bin006]